MVLTSLSFLRNLAVLKCLAYGTRHERQTLLLLLLLLFFILMLLRLMFYKVDVGIRVYVFCGCCGCCC